MEHRTITLENWSLTYGPPNPYVPPEGRATYLQGIVFGHPNYEDGAQICTSKIVGVDDRTVTTKTGTQYTLGNICPAYLDWCKRTEGVRVPEEGDWIRVHD